MMSYAPAVLFHLLPIIPLAFGHYFLGAAVILLVGLAYIKVKKLRQTEIERAARGGAPDEGLRKTREFWERLTFLR